VTKKDEISNLAPDQRKSSDRRQAERSDRRKESAPVAVERRKLERREKVNRRRQIDPTTCERDYSIDEVEFMNAMDQYKRKSGRMFPTCSEILEVIRNLGYTKPGQLPPSAEPFNPDAAPATESTEATEVVETTIA
jgi:hypothetical protein